MQYALDEITFGQMNAVVKKIGGKTAVERFLRNELVIVEASSLAKPKRASKAKPEHALDTIVRVDRTIKPSYPDWMKDVLHPELEQSGPAEFDLSKLNQWLHDGQKGTGYVRGQKIYDHLKNEGMLESCLNLQDALAIQKMGIAVFRKHFSGKAIFFWKSVVRSRNGYLRVPYLVEGGGQVKLYWLWLGVDWNELRPALRFASQN